MFKTFALAALIAVAALPVAGGVQNVSIVQDPVTRNVTVSYNLTSEAVVTIDVFTNGAPVEAKVLASMAGDVNRKLAAGDHMAFWRPDRCWPGYRFDANVTARVTAWPVDNPPDFMVVDLLFPSNVTYYASVDALPYDLTNKLYKTDKLVMRKIPSKGVRWRMGAPKSAANNNSDWCKRETVHYVTFTNNYYMAIFPVTHAQYRRIDGRPVDVDDAAIYHVAQAKIYYMNLRGSKADGYDWPITGSSVRPDSTIGLLRSRTGIDSLDLPTEAEWEYACRAGTATDFNNGMNLSGTWDAAPGGIAVTGSGPQIVGTKPCNNWNLYDFHGNVTEWCLDWYLTTPYPENSEQTNPTGPRSDDAGAPTKRCYRGGYYNTGNTASRSAFRNYGDPNNYVEWAGFRLKCAAVAK
jgi:formylglycine-generating enzyme required for sulfatase activity